MPESRKVIYSVFLTRLNAKDLARPLAATTNVVVSYDPMLKKFAQENKISNVSPDYSQNA